MALRANAGACIAMSMASVSHRGGIHKPMADGEDKAYFGQTMQDMQFGQGIPPSRDSCRS